MLPRFTISQLRPFSIGFDEFFNFAENFALHDIDNSFPRYNIIKNSNTSYTIEMALAGYSKEDINITYQDGILTISHQKDATTDKSIFLHKGISTRSFTKSFTLAENVKVLDASFINGLLKIDIEKIIPEERKKKSISIR
jgi:molecular chaperone IbpA